MCSKYKKQYKYKYKLMNLKIYTYISYDNFFLINKSIFLTNLNIWKFQTYIFQ